MKLSQNEIIEMMNLLGIRYSGQPNHKGWIDIVCPLHNDKDYGNAGVNIHNGFISCFKCHQKKHIEELYNEVYVEGFNRSNAVTDDEIKSIIQERKKPDKSYVTTDDYNFTHVPLANKVDKYLYLKQRGFTSEFCEEFNIRLCISKPYEDFIIIPIKDEKKNIYEFEARKIKEYEVLKKFFENLIVPDSYKELKRKFESYKEEFRLKYRKGKIIQKSEKEGGEEKIIDNPILLYLMTPKVKYIPFSLCDETLWNIDNLDRTKRLYVVEGCGSLPKIYCNISKNVTTLFGSKVADAQIDYLKEFEEIVLIPDPDEAGYDLIFNLHSKGLKNLYVKDIGIEDTHNEYVNRIKNYDIISGAEYVTKNILRIVKNSCRCK